MSVQTPFFTGVSTVPARVTRELPFRIIPRIETYRESSSFCQTIPGQAVLLTAFGLVYASFNPNALPLTLCLALLTWIPGRRNQLLCVSTLMFRFACAVARTAEAALPRGTGAGVPRFWLAVDLVPREVAAILVRTKSAEILIAGFGIWVATISLVPWRFFQTVTLWDLSIVFGSYLWYVGYILMDRRSRADERIWHRSRIASPLLGFTLHTISQWGRLPAADRSEKSRAPLDHAAQRD